MSYKQNSRDFMDEVLQELEVGPAACRQGLRTAPCRGSSQASRPPCPQNFDLEQKEEDVPDPEQHGSTESPSSS